MATLPNYYSALGMFRAVFRRGLPILTYHKLGPRPRGARLKGLHVSATLFTQQLAELRAAGFMAGSLDDWRAPTAPASPRVVITFDDGFISVLEHGLAPLRQHGFTAIEFLVADRLGAHNDWEMAEGEVRAPLMDRAQVRDWLAAGHAIGAHSLTHPWLTRLPSAQAREEITASRKQLEDTFGVPVRHFCYPYGDWNPAVRDLVAEAGYATACTTTAGMNPPEGSPFELRRFTARYPSRNLRTLWQRLKTLGMRGHTGA